MVCFAISHSSEMKSLRALWDLRHSRRCFTSLSPVGGFRHICTAASKRRSLMRGRRVSIDLAIVAWDLSDKSAFEHQSPMRRSITRMRSRWMILTRKRSRPRPHPSLLFPLPTLLRLRLRPKQTRMRLCWTTRLRRLSRRLRKRRLLDSWRWTNAFRGGNSSRYVQ